MPYLHLPVQAGSDKILKAMNRKHTAEDYIKLVDRIRAARPDIALSSDFIVGFPSETEEDFTATLDLVRQVTYAQAYSFKYSPRPGTPASEEAQIDEDVKSERLARLQDVLNIQQVNFNASQAGETLEVLFEKQGKKPGQMVGRSPYLQTVHVDADETVIGKILPVKIEMAHANSLSGKIFAV
jgi:tRNA-2-methylthio-N6-dimethylallyladenosine synthase